MEELKIGDIIKQRYSLVQFLGSGSFGEVWLAHDQMTGRDVALKIYISLDPAGVEEFQREYSNTADLSSPYLLTPEFFDVHNRRPFLVMKYCANGSSSKLAGQISEDKLWAFIHDVASGLEVLHSQSDPIVHQDIKPDNILVDSNGRFLITDFGISKRLRATMRRQSKRDVSSGAMPYMAPELFDSVPKLNPASDIWSLGASIYELVTGELPLNGFGGCMLKHGAEIPSLGTSVSQSLNDLMIACLSPEPAIRPTAKEIVEAASKKSFREAIKKTDVQKPVIPSGKTTIRETKNNISNHHVIYSVIAAAVVLIGYWIYNSHILTGLKSPNVVSTDTLQSNASTIMSDTTSISTHSIKDVGAKVEEKSVVPKPQKVNGSNNLPFNPAGCPYLYIKGSDKNAMLNHRTKSVRIYANDYTLTMGDQRPNGCEALISYGKYEQNLLFDLPEEDEEDRFDDFGFLNPEWNMQITLMDFDNDNECELLFTIQSEEHPWGTITLVYKLIPNPYKDSIAKYLGSITAYDKLYIDGTKIVAPHFRSGLEQEYIIDPNGKLICITN